MAKFHLTPKGQARQCSAQTPESCRYSQEAGEVVAHYDTKEEAQKAYEKQAANEHSATKSLSKSSAKNNENSPVKAATKMSDKELFNHLNIDFDKFDNSVAENSIEDAVREHVEYDTDSDYDYDYSDYDSDYDSYDMNRSATISGIENISRKQMAESIADGLLPKGLPRKQDTYQKSLVKRIEPLVESYGINDTGNYELNIDDSYYGEEVSGVTLHNKEEINDFVEEVKKLVK